MKTNWYVITGAPSSGKSTLIDYLSKEGYITYPETARIYIDEQLAKGVTLEELRKDENHFQETIFSRNQKLEEGIDPQKLVFLDRGLPDSLAFYKLSNIDTTKLKALCHKNYAGVFLLEPLAFQEDGVRIENKQTAEKLHRFLKEAYSELGYKVISVPVASVEKRAKLILEKVSANSVA